MLFASDDTDMVEIWQEKYRIGEITSVTELEGLVKERVPVAPVTSWKFSGYLDTPAQGEYVPEAELFVEGWLYLGSGIQKVNVCVGNRIYPAYYGLNRREISELFPDLGTKWVGFGVWIPTNEYTQGVYTINVTAESLTGEEFSLPARDFWIVRTKKGL